MYRTEIEPIQRGKYEKQINKMERINETINKKEKQERKKDRKNE